MSITSRSDLRPGRDRSAAIAAIRRSSSRSIKLYRLTGDRRRLDLAAYFIDERGRSAALFHRGGAWRAARIRSDFWAKTYEYNQSHMPVREQNRVVGHAVRAMYMDSAMADLAAELGDEGLKRACEALWRDVTTAQMYVTAGLGPKETNEGFTEPYDLPNETAYAETCASVALIFWAQRMLHLDLDGRYADVMELALYNGALCRPRRATATHYFYSNPLESDGQHRRWDWHLCPCCTMNVSRLVASVAGYFLSTRDDGVAFHLYGGSSPRRRRWPACKVALTRDERLSLVGRDPHRDRSRGAGDFDLKLRIPGWARGATAAVNGEPIDAPAATRLSRHRPALAPGDTVDARSADAGRAALRPSERARRRARGAPARPADLLRRGGRQSRRTGPAAPAAPRPRTRDRATR